MTSCSNSPRRYGQGPVPGQRSGEGFGVVTGKGTGADGVRRVGSGAAGAGGVGFVSGAGEGVVVNISLFQIHTE